MKVTALAVLLRRKLGFCPQYRQAPMAVLLSLVMVFVRVNRGFGWYTFELGRSVTNAWILCVALFQGPQTKAKVESTFLRRCRLFWLVW